MTAMLGNIASQVGNSPSLTNEIIDQNITCPLFYLPFEQGLARQPSKSVRSRMPDHVALPQTFCVWTFRIFAYYSRQSRGDSIKASFERMNRRDLDLEVCATRVFLHEMQYPGYFRGSQHIFQHGCRSYSITRLCRGIVRILLYR